ncbi:MAG: HupE/UreJ family protein, partial [Verrucomicrobiota bacterium]|nr:HupE/UreJ family protein [Verrucomicrobiota bacterium]
FSIRLTFSGDAPSHLRVRSLLLESLPAGHRQYLSFEDGKNPAPEERLLSAEENFFEINLAPTAVPKARQSYSFSDFLFLGVKHIFTGYDHLLFLLGLLIVCESFSSVVKIITCFTLAHSLTLALATLNIVQIPSRFVEPAIAASIIYVGLENLFRRGHLNYRWLLTLAFGLIHGFGFASVLREMGIASSDKIAVPLVSFNLGVELGQITIAAIVLPILWQLKQKPKFALQLVPVCSAIIVAAGSYWFIERVWLH